MADEGKKTVSSTHCQNARFLHLSARIAARPWRNTDEAAPLPPVAVPFRSRAPAAVRAGCDDAAGAEARDRGRGRHRLEVDRRDGAVERRTVVRVSPRA